MNDNLNDFLNPANAVHRAAAVDSLLIPDAHSLVASVGVLINKLVAENGITELSVAAGSDMGLSTDKKLKLLSIADNHSFADRVSTALSGLSDIPNTESAVISFCESAIVGILIFGFYDFDSDDTLKVEESAAYAPRSAVNESSVNKALGLVVATKINLFLQNHHVGQGGLSGYPAKMLRALYEIQGPASDSWYSAIHRMGHSASTHAILAALGISGLRPVTRGPEHLRMSFSGQVLNRVAGHPSGCARLYLAKAILDRLANSVAAKVTPNFADFRVILSEYLLVRARPARFHVGSLFLTGLPRLPFNENAVSACMGRLGTFITVFYEHSSIAKSPSVNCQGNRAYEGYEDFSPDYLAALRGLRAAAVDAARNSLTAIMGDISLNSTADINLMRQNIARANAGEALVDELIEEDSEAEE